MAAQILCRVHAGQTVGLGHLMRARLVAEELAKRLDGEITFALPNLESSIARLLQDNSFRVTRVQAELYAANWDIVVTDDPELQPAELERLRQCARTLVSIDDESRIEFCSDILVAPNFSDFEHARGAHTIYLRGNQHILLRKEFGDYGARVREVNPRTRNVLICFGGSDPNNLTARTVSAIQKTEFDDSALVILGAAFRDPESISKLIGQDERFELRQNVSPLAPLFWNADIAILAGGTLLYETCVLGTPSIILCQNRSQNEEADRFSKHGAVINLGEWSHVSLSEFAAVFDSLRQRHARRQQLSTHARALVDGRGVERVVNAILEFHKTR